MIQLLMFFIIGPQSPCQGLTRIDGAIKEEAAVVLAAMGLTVSDAVRMLLTRMADLTALFDDLNADT